MTMIKSLILGSAAGLVALSGAQAADLPVKAKAVEYVRICSLYGAGFFYIPGTDTCIKLGGYVRVDTTFNGGTYGQPCVQRRPRPGQSLSRLLRRPFSYGAERRYPHRHRIRRRPHLRSGDFQFNSFGTSQPDHLDHVPGLQRRAGYYARGAAAMSRVDLVFIQFAGFTFGKSASAYATPWHGLSGQQQLVPVGGHDYVTGVNNIQYTAQFGNGVSATIGLDNSTVLQPYWSAEPRRCFGVRVAAGANAYGGTHAPDIVGNIRVDQAWGLFQISGMAHLVNASYNNLGAAGAPGALSEISGHPEDKWGGAVMAALQIKNLPTGAGRRLSRSTSPTPRVSPRQVIPGSHFAMFGGTGRAGAYQSVGFGQLADGVYTAWRSPTALSWSPRGVSVVRSTTTGIPTGRPACSVATPESSYGGSALDVTSAKGAFCANYTAAQVAAASADYSCNPDFNIAQVGVVTRWTPVKNLTFSAEVGAFFLDQKFTGAATLAAVGSEADRRVRVQGPEHCLPERSRSA